jgi:magnesium transporter
MPKLVTLALVNMNSHKDHSLIAGAGNATKIEIVNYNVNDATAETLTEFDSKHCGKDGYISWIGVSGLQNQKAVNDIGKCFNLHPLVVEDILHTDQRPKVDQYEDHLYVVLRIFFVKKGELVSEQVSFVLRDNLLLSFEEISESVFSSIRSRILLGPGNIRRKGEDYLLYTLLDYIVDQYFEVLEEINTRIEQIEEEIIRHARKSTLQKLMDLKRELITLRKNIWPMREMLITLQRNEVEFFESENSPFLRDLMDHVIRTHESTESYREILTSLTDMYYNQVSNQMNEVMKTLTVISSIFIPLTFIVGVYGMNFKHMPELEWPNGYYLTLEGMAVITIGMLVYFWRKKWF